MPAAPAYEIVVGVVSFLLTVMVLLYLIGDNPAFRVAVYVFVGVAAGYAGAVAWHQVLKPHLITPLLNGNWGDRVLAVIPLVLGVMLLMKLSQRTARLGNPAIAFLVGAGAAVAIGGAVLGTLFPQTEAAINVFDLSGVGAGAAWWERLFTGLFMLVGTLATLVYFHFGAKSTPGGPQRSKLVEALAWIGQGFIAITFGVLFAGVFAAALTALIERVNFLLAFVEFIFKR